MHNAGSSPFGLAGNPSVVTFQTGSEANWLTSAGFQGSGRTYADLSIGNGTTAASVSDAGSSSFSVDTLKVESPSGTNSSFAFTSTGGSVTVTKDIIFAGTGTGALTNGVTLQRTGGTVDFTAAAHSIYTLTSATKRTVTFG